jgi:pimeloyl-ACP methyl ester carboxylesterase
VTFQSSPARVNILSSQIGLWPYIPFLRSLASQDPDVGILALEFLPISSRITSPPLDSQATCQAIERILNFHQLSQFVVASHSYGTAVTAHIYRSPTLSPRVAAVLLVDPINFLLHHPSVAFNFLYRSPRSANEWQLWYFASRDPDIARTLGRYFFWSECILWKEDLAGKNISIVLSEMDQIVDANSVRKYLTGSEDQYWQRDGLEVLWYTGLDHATVFDTKRRMQPLLNIVKRFTMISENNDTAW